MKLVKCANCGEIIEIEEALFFAKIEEQEPFYCGTCDPLCGWDASENDDEGEPCPYCDGSGIDELDEEGQCYTCGGTGRLWPDQ